MMKRKFILIILMIGFITTTTSVMGANGDTSTPSKPVLFIYTLLFFLMNSLQEMFEVLIFAFIWKEFFHILRIRTEVKS